MAILDIRKQKKSPESPKCETHGPGTFRLEPRPEQKS